MLKKTHALALTVATAGLLGFAAPMASAATMSTRGRVVNVSNNQVPIQACGNDVDGNFAGGQVPVEGAAVVGSLLSPGSVTKATAINNRGCTMDNSQTTATRTTTRPVQRYRQPGAGPGLRQRGQRQRVRRPGAAVRPVRRARLLSPASLTKSTAVNNQGCELSNQPARQTVRSNPGRGRAAHSDPRLPHGRRGFLLPRLAGNRPGGPGRPRRRARAARAPSRSRARGPRRAPRARGRCAVPGRRRRRAPPGRSAPAARRPARPA